MSNVMEDFADKLMQHPTDPRVFGSYATVGVLDDKGELDIDERDDKMRFINDTGSEILVSVVCHPSGMELEARLTSQNAGDNTAIQFPIRGGDEVFVEFPEGNPNNLPFISQRLNNVGRVAPEGFDNETVRVFVGDYPVKIENEQGHTIKFNADGSLEFSGGPVTVNSNGAVNVEAKGSVNVNTKGSASVNAKGSVSVKGTTSAEVEALAIKLNTLMLTIGKTEVPGVSLGLFLMDLLLYMSKPMQMFMGIDTMPSKDLLEFIAKWTPMVAAMQKTIVNINP